MNKLKLFFIVVFSILLFIACNKKEKENVGYKKVINNKYQWDKQVFHFGTSDSCYCMIVDNVGVTDSNTVLKFDYIVRGDSIIIDYNSYKGIIKNDRLILKYGSIPQEMEFIKIN